MVSNEPSNQSRAQTANWMHKYIDLSTIDTVNLFSTVSDGSDTSDVQKVNESDVFYQFFSGYAKIPRVGNQSDLSNSIELICLALTGSVQIWWTFNRYQRRPYIPRIDTRA